MSHEIWDQSILLNERRQDHPISPSTLTGIAKRGDCTCQQHALFILRWLGRTPDQLRGIRTARYAIGMRLMMRIVQWLERPAAAFIRAAQW